MYQKPVLLPGKQVNRVLADHQLKMNLIVILSLYSTPVTLSHNRISHLFALRNLWVAFVVCKVPSVFLHLAEFKQILSLCSSEFILLLPPAVTLNTNNPTCSFQNTTSTVFDRSCHPGPSSSWFHPSKKSFSKTF